MKFKKKKIPIICILWMKIEHENEISTLKDNNLKHETIMQSSKYNSEGSTELIRTTRSTTRNLNAFLFFPTHME